ncbi:MAG: ABC transporter ATP-binding protein, partial [Clostridiales bacterium]|nr:ABC transporter ATP-binding protein [Clostridiales bacterium]
AVFAAHENALSSDARMRSQSGIMLAKAFYQELGADIYAMQSAYILQIGLIMLLIALVGGVATVLVSYLSAKIATGVARNLRKDVFNKIESFSNKEFDKFGTASLITRCTNDVTQMQQLLQMGIRMVFFAPIMGIGGVVMAVNKSSSMSWILGLAGIVIMGMITLLFSIALPKFKIIQKLIDKLNLVSRENLSGLMVIRAFGTQKHEKKRFESANAELTRTNLFVNRLMSVMMPMMTIVMNGLTLLIVWVGAKQIAASTMQVGDMMAYMQYAMQVLMSFMMVSMMFIMAPRAAVSATRIADVLYTELSITDPISPAKFNANKKGTLEFKHVNFRYDGAEENALCDIDFTALPGQTTAIIGSTGSGKSTIANLALRLYDVSEGQIRVDGVDIREVTQKDLRAKIGYVPQKGVLLSGTVAFNLKYGKRDATDLQMQTAADVAQASGFILERPEGFEAPISQGGANVSGGQKQRLSIARALVKDPEILIFDDSFSALDFKTDVALRKALKQHTGESTIIIIAQRVSSIKNAQQILVLEEGRIVGRGTHQELLKNCKEYYEIASSQLGEGELA